MRKPYIIYTPPYSPLSAGIKSLYMLCNALVSAGEDAEMRMMGIVNPAPIPDDAIAVYPEIISGNPLNANHVVRWLLYYAGRYRGNRNFPETDMIVGYTTRIAKDYGTDAVLFLPTIDETVFTPPTEPLQRKGSCFYAHKHKTFYGANINPEMAGIEITNPGQSREELIRLLQTSEVLYAYEDTALIIEAVLCGCPVICVPSEQFPECCGLDDFSAGIAWGMEDYWQAKATLPNARKDYVALKTTFKEQLTEFIERTQA